MKFCPTPRKINSHDLSKGIVKLERNVRLAFQHGFGNSSYDRKVYVPNLSYEPKKAPGIIEKLFTIMKCLAAEYKTAKNFINNLNYRERNLLKFLKRQNEFKIIQTDKNLGPGLMTTSQYVQWCNQHLETTAVYEKLLCIPFDDIMSRIIDFHKMYIRFVNKCSVNTKTQLINNAHIITHYLINAKPCYFYGLAKIHKTPFALRPIISCTNSHVTGLSKWITHQLSYIIDSLPYVMSCSNDIIDTIHSIPTCSNTFCITLDIVQLYTSIPTVYIHDIVAHYINDNPLKNMILKGIDLLLDINYFTFGNDCWRQKHGLAMGQSSSPILAILYVAYFERLVIPKFNKHILFYKRYIDDILIIWKEMHEEKYAWNKFLAQMKNSIPGLDFTISNRGNEVPFLDITIFKNGSTFGTKTFEKSLNLYLYTTQKSAHPPGTLKGLVTGFMIKFKRQNSNKEDSLKCINMLFQRLVDRGFRSQNLKPIFKSIYIKIFEKQATQTDKKKSHQIFFPIQFDPNGPSKTELKKILKLEELSKLTMEAISAKITICYTNPPNLMRMIAPTKLSCIKSTNDIETHQNHGLADENSASAVVVLHPTTWQTTIYEEDHLYLPL